MLTRKKQLLAMMLALLVAGNCWAMDKGDYESDGDEASQDCSSAADQVVVDPDHTLLFEEAMNEQDGDAETGEPDDDTMALAAQGKVDLELVLNAFDALEEHAEELDHDGLEGAAKFFDAEVWLQAPARKSYDDVFAHEPVSQAGAERFIAALSRARDELWRKYEELAALFHQLTGDAAGRAAGQAGSSSDGEGGAGMDVDEDGDDDKNRELLKAAFCAGLGVEDKLDKATIREIKKLKGAVGRLLTVRFEELARWADVLLSQRRSCVVPFYSYEEWRAFQDLEYYRDLLQRRPATRRDAEHFIAALEQVRDNLTERFNQGFDLVGRFEQAVKADLAVQGQEEKEKMRREAADREMLEEDLYDSKAARRGNYQRRSKYN